MSRYATDDELIGEQMVNWAFINFLLDNMIMNEEIGTVAYVQINKHLGYWMNLVD